jgi:hypothetical protein
MAKTVAKSSSTPPKRRPALTAEARENQIISLAHDLAERQILDGTASSQVITYYLKLGSAKERLEVKRLEEENKLLRAKTEAIQSQERVEKMYADALNAMRSYSGHGGPVEDED